VTVEDRIKQLFPTLFITLVSVLIGLFFADLLAEAHGRMALWPLDWMALRSWGQIAGMTASAIAVWAVYAHIGITRQRVARLSDTLITFVVPIPLLIGNSFVGRAEIWPWFYYAAGYLVLSIFTTMWHVQLALAEPDLQPMRRILRPAGHMWVLVISIFTCLLFGFFDQHHLLSPPLGALAAWSTMPEALAFSWLFFREWHAAIAESSASALQSQPAG
jgi:hypothetical protein